MCIFMVVKARSSLEDIYVKYISKVYVGEKLSTNDKNPIKLMISIYRH